MKTKVCSICKIEKSIFEFYKDKSRKDGFNYRCKFCVRQYNKNKAPQIAKRAKQYHKDNAPRISKQKKQYYRENTGPISKQHKQYRENNAEKIKKQSKSNANFDLYCDRLGVFEKIRRYPGDQGLLEVRCAYCGKWMKPSKQQVKNRLQVFSGTMLGEARFYCSENCKQSCPTYDQNKYPKGFKKATSREVVPLLRQMVLERDNYTCQKCGATSETAQLHVHHEKSYTLNKIMANDPDNCITLCKKCHKEVHSQDGCRYVDLKC